jgi:hypothetical protein
MTLCRSRHRYAEIVLHQTVERWLTCHRRAFEWFGGRAGGHRQREVGYGPAVQRSYAAPAEAYDSKIDACPPRRRRVSPNRASITSRSPSFVPLRELRDLADANRLPLAFRAMYYQHFLHEIDALPEMLVI